MKSDFGQGLCYCLGLFIAHEHKFMESRELMKKSKLDWAGMWFNASSDHFYDLQIPQKLNSSLRTRLRKLQRKCLHWGHGFSNKDEAKETDVVWAIQEAKTLLRLIDKANGIATKKGTWE